MVLTRLGLRGSFTYNCKSSEDEIRVSRLLGRTLGTITTSVDVCEERRRLDRLPELTWGSESTPTLRADRLELDLRDEERVGFVKLSQDDSEDSRDRCRRGTEEEDMAFTGGSACTATEHILLLVEDFLLADDPSSRIVSMGRLDLLFGRLSPFNRIPDSLISITD